MTDCAFCGLPVGRAPVTADGTAFCCTGCRHVAERLQGVDAEGDEPQRGDTLDTAAEVPEGAEEAFISIDGMHCVSCEALLERTAADTTGIISVSTNYATETGRVVYDPDRIDRRAIPDVLSVAGYRARFRGTGPAPVGDDRIALLRLLVGITSVMMVMLVYVAYFYPTYLGILPPTGSGPGRSFAGVFFPWFVAAIATVAVGFVGRPILRNAAVGLRTGVLNMDVLIAIAVLAAYLYSLVRLVQGGGDLYFDVATVVIGVVTVGRDYEARTKRRATESLHQVLEERTGTVRVRGSSDDRTVAVEDLSPGDEVIVRAGESIPVDGTVIEGQAAVNQALVTGESVPVRREPGDAVIGGTVVVENAIVVRVENGERTIDRLARIFWAVQSETPGVQQVANRVAAVFVPVVLLLAIGTMVVQFALRGLSDAVVLAGLATLIVSCPCAFGLATPLGVTVGLRTALDNGIVIASTDVFEKASDVDIVAFDKTGTLSSGTMTVMTVLGDDRVASRAAAVEQHSNHPIAAAIADLPTSIAASDVRTHPGTGVVGNCAGDTVAVGSVGLFEDIGWPVPDTIRTAASAASDGGVISYVGWDGMVRGAIITADTGRRDWRAILERLGTDARVVLLTGDSQSRGFDDMVDEAYVGLPPDAKAETIRRLKRDGTVAMIGDGTNDAPALAAADLGIAFADPTALAADAADVIITDDELDRIPALFDLIAGTRTRIRQNLGWAFLYNLVAIPLAIVGLINPLLAALAMAASSLLVVGNSTRTPRGFHQSD